MASDIEGHDLLVLAEKAPEQMERYAKDGYKLRVVQWCGSKRDGGIFGSVKLERRKLYLADGGEVREGKAEGFTLEDLAVVQKEWARIVNTMKHPPPPSLKEKPPEAAGPSDALEEVPF